jgi:Zn-dependent protease
MYCPQCDTRLPDDALSCPSCGQLLYSARLQELSNLAKLATQSGDLSAARQHWLEALQLLPKETVQYRTIEGRIADLDSQIAAHEAATSQKRAWGKRLGKLSPLGVLLWKFKTIALLVVAKGKFILLGLTKFSTIATMLLSFGVYWTAWGWMFAAGFVLSIYIHEMGHVAALRRFGVAATAPMFIPGFGALIWQKEAAKNSEQDAIVGLAGPLWGTGAALFALAVFGVTHTPVWGAIARTGAWINLFNLSPIWFLDGSHAFRALARRERGIIAGVAVAMWLATDVGMLLLVAALAGFRMFTKDAPERSSNLILMQFIGLLVVLGLVASIVVNVVRV